MAAGEAVEDAGPGHEDLALDGLFGGAAEHLESALDLVPGHDVLDRRGGGDDGRAEEVMAAAVPGRAGQDRGLGAGRLLGEAGKRVVLGEKPDHRLARSVDADERRGQAGHSPFDLETPALEVGGQGSGGFVFLHGRFGRRPDRVADLEEPGGVGVKPGDRLFLERRQLGGADLDDQVIVLLGGGRRAGCKKEYGDPENEPGLERGQGPVRRQSPALHRQVFNRRSG